MTTGKLLSVEEERSKSSEIRTTQQTRVIWAGHTRISTVRDLVFP
jgi:hypothetical protein